MAPKYSGPYRVVESSLPNVTIDKDGKSYVTNVDRLRRCWKTPPVQPEPAAQDSDDEEEVLGEPEVAQPVAPHPQGRIPIPAVSKYNRRYTPVHRLMYE